MILDKNILCDNFEDCIGCPIDQGNENKNLCVMLSSNKIWSCYGVNKITSEELKKYMSLVDYQKTIEEYINILLSK